MKPEILITILLTVHFTINLILIFLHSWNGDLTFKKTIKVLLIGWIVLIYENLKK